MPSGKKRGVKDHPTESENQKKRLVLSRRSYTADEELKVLEKLREKIVSGQELEKPTATEFYRSLSDELKLSGASGISLSNKVRAMKNKYDAALKWRSLSGEGMDGETLSEKLHSICRNFHLLDEIYGCRITFHPLYESESGSVADRIDNDTQQINSVEVRQEKEESKVEILKIHQRKEKPVSDYVKVSNAHKDVKLAQYSVEEQKIKFELQKLQSEVSSNDKKMDLESKKFSLDERKLTMEEKLFDLQSQRHNDEMELKREEMRMKLTIRKLEMEHELKMAQLK